MPSSSFSRAFSPMAYKTAPAKSPAKNAGHSQTKKTATAIIKAMEAFSASSVFTGFSLQDCELLDKLRETRERT